jgi:NADH dehydrogenase (ubiquinone) Fe-S protein 3
VQFYRPQLTISNFGDAASPWEQVGAGVETSPETYKIPPPPKEEKKEEKK